MNFKKITLLFILVQVLLGPLPSGFLRADGATDSLDADYQAALALQQQLCGATVSSKLQFYFNARKIPKDSCYTSAVRVLF